MDKLFDRAFSRAHGSVDAVVGAAAAAPKQEVASREERLRTLVTPMTSEDVVARIGLAFRDGDYYRLLQLPGPTLNSLGRAEWTVTQSELGKAFRRLSVLVHPDKNPGEDARTAFEQLKTAYNELRDEDKLAVRLREAEPSLQAAEERAVAAASAADRVTLNAAVEERRVRARQEEARAFQQEIQEQARRRAAEAAAKKARAAGTRYGRAAEPAERGDGGSDSDDDDEYAQRQVAKRRKKPSFM